MGLRPVRQCQYIGVWCWNWRIYKKSDKNNKELKDYNYLERLKKLGITTLQERRMRDYLTETFKMINVISYYGRHFFNIFPCTRNFLSRQISKAKTKSNNLLDFFFANRVIYFWNKLSNLIENRKSGEKLRLNWMILEITEREWM